MNRKIFVFTSIIISLLLCLSCSSDSSSDTPEPNPSPTKTLEIKGADFSFLPEIRKSGQKYYNQKGVEEDMLTTFKNSGGNVVRLRVWVSPSTTTSNLNSVKALAQEVKSKGMKVMLTVHYSDTWADPSNQTKPTVWQTHTFTQLKTDVYNYTQQIMTEINPEYIQIGNEINNGILWPEGNAQNLSQFKELLQSGISAVRNTNSNTKIILHYAGHEGAVTFFNNLSGLDYDIIGLSYYPIWHGKDLTVLQQNLTTLSNQFNKSIFIAEIAYPFTLGWNDNTQNVVGLNSQLLSNFSATSQGQKDYLSKIKQIITDVPKGIGFCYWGSEWTSYKGNVATDGSSWENQAFWSFDNKALPVLDAYK